MSRWERALDAAGVQDPTLRADYGRQRQQVTRYKREVTLAAALLLPDRTAPHVIAAAAFMHRTDTLLDSGPLAQRRAAATRWQRQVTESLAADRTDDPELRPLLNSVHAHPVLRDRVLDFLAAAEADLDFTGFATEQDYQAYVDGYSLPGFMVVAALLGPDGDQSAYRAGCRTFIDASQRLDFVNDLAEDLADGRLTIPEQTLTTHGLTRADLEQARDLPAVRALLGAQLDLVDRTLAEAGAVVDLVPAVHRPMVRCMVGVDELTSAAARADLGALLRRSASPSKPAALRLLGREYLRARRLRERRLRGV
ncbi:phytoene/squalene synthase family protein [Streptomyces sp. 1331.2]|uniref:phytoene/squalene synthase family protein n=1 Tax=Streptomyces sp. 1331.2 TaxID=1938835 RepID=UPI000BD7BD5C|nr:squalene/phytoene synthase family protein [Streptomyces sp. 1331.2]SOB86309.1 phytoene synthase [Streptomyces sp. 1331.2]